MRFIRGRASTFQTRQKAFRLTRDIVRLLTCLHDTPARDVKINAATRSREPRRLHRGRFVHAQKFSGRGGTDVPRTAPLSPLTGRDTEVSLLTDRWEQAQEGAGQMVLIIGEAGLGKSRLVQTIREIAQAEAGHLAVIEWRCSERFQGTGLHPVIDHLQRLFAFAPEESPSARLDRLAQYLEDFGLGRPETVALFANLIFLPHDVRYPAAEPDARA